MSEHDFGLGLTVLWLCYGLLSSLALLKLRSAGASKRACVTLASCLTVVDLIIPLTYDVAVEHEIAVSVVLFLFPVTRPTKLLLYAVGSGPLAHAEDTKTFLLLAVLPVVPLRCLPHRVQQRMRVYQLASARALELSGAVVAVLAGALLMRMYAPVPVPTLRTRVGHVASFVGFLMVLLDGSAALATALGAGPVVTPFNSFLLATSVHDWWRYRWDTIIALTLRMSVYDPVATQLTTNGARRGPQVLPALLTFVASAAVHEYSCYAVSRQLASIGQVSKFFLAQPVLMAAERPLQRGARALLKLVGVTDGTSAAVVQHVVTITLVAGSVYYLWCPSYDRPVSTANEGVADAVLRAIGLCSSVPYCDSRL